MQFTYRNPERSTDPARILAGAGPSWWGPGLSPPRSPAPLTDGRNCRERRGPSPGWPAMPAPTTTPRLRTALAGVAERLELEGWRRQGRLRRQRPRRPGRRPPGRARLVRQEHTASFARARLVVRARVGRDRCPLPTPVDALRPREGCGTCSRCLAACPTGALDEPGVVDARRCLAWLLQAPGSFPIEHRQALGDRIYGCDECQAGLPDQPGRRPQSPRTSGGGPDTGPGRFLGILRASDGELLAPTAGGTSLAATPLSAPERARGPRQRGRRPRPGDGGRTLGDAGRRPAGRARPLGRRRLGRNDLVTAPEVSHLLVTNDFPPKLGGIQAYLWELWQRLDPDSFVVLTARPIPMPPRSTASSEPVASDRTRAGPVLVPAPMAVGSDSCPSLSGDLVVIDPAFPLGLVGPHLGLPYAVVLHGAEVALPGRLPITVSSSPCSATVRWPWPPVATRPARGSGPQWRAVPPVAASRPASTSTGSAARRRRPAAARSRPRAPPTDHWWSA